MVTADCGRKSLIYSYCFHVITAEDCFLARFMKAILCGRGKEGEAR